MNLLVMKKRMFLTVATMILMTLFSISVIDAQPETSFEIIDSENAKRIELHAVLGNGIIKDLEWSRDGQTLIVATTSEIFLLNPQHLGSQTSSIGENLSGVVDISLSPDGTSLATVDSSGSVHLLDLETGTSESIFEHHSRYVTQVMFSPDGSILAAGGCEAYRFYVSGSSTGSECKVPTVFIIDLPTRTVSATLHGNEKQISSLAFSPDGSVLVSGSWDSTVRIWNVPNWSLRAVLRDHYLNVFSVAIRPDGEILATSDVNGAIRIWNLQTGALIESMDRHSNPVTSLAFSPDGAFMASGDSYGTLRIWDAMSQRSLFRRNMGGVRVLAFSPDGKQLAAGSEGAVRLWDVTTGQNTRSAQIGTGRVKDVAFDPSGTLIAAGTDGGELQLWDTSTLESHSRWQGHSDRMTSVVFSPDGTLLASSSYDTKVKIWDPLRRSELSDFSEHVSVVWDVTFSPSGEFLTSAGADQEVIVRNLDDDAPDFSRHRMGESAGPVSYSPDGALLAVAVFGGQIILADPVTVEPVIVLNHGNPHTPRFAFNRDGDMLASVGGNTAHLWRVPSGDSVAVFDTLGEVTCVAFNHDGQVIAVGIERSIQLWDVATGQRIAKLEGHIDWVTSVEFSPDGTLLASASHDGTIRLWRVGDEIQYQATCVVTSLGNVNLRDGPGTEFAPISSLSSGETQEADGQTEGADGLTWYQLTSGMWVRSDVVSADEECRTLAVVEP